VGRELVGHDLGQASKGDIVMGVSYRSPDDYEEAKSLDNLRKSGSQPVDLTGDLKVFVIYWKSDMVGCKLARTFLESIRINFCHSQRRWVCLGES